MSAYTTKEVLRVLHQLFPHNPRLSYSHLTSYKVAGLIKTSGGEVRHGGRSDLYSFEDMVCLAACIDLRNAGLDMRLVAKRFYQCMPNRARLDPKRMCSGRIGRLTWSYPIGKIEQAVKEALEEQSNAGNSLSRYVSSV